MGKTMDEQIYYENHQGLTEPGFPVISREYAIRRGGEEVRLHWHEGVELLYVLAGSCKVARNLRTAELTKGDMALISAGQLHRIFVDEEDVRYEYLILERELWEELSLPLGEDQFTASVIRDEKLTWMLKELAELRGRQGSYVQIQKRGLLFLLMGRLLECYRAGEARDTCEDKRISSIRKAISYIEAFYIRPITIEELAETAGYSKYHFCRCFKNVTGMTPVEYMNRLRCERAKSILASGEKTVSEAAKGCGFSNMSHFYRMYKRYVEEAEHKEKETIP